MKRGFLLGLFVVLLMSQAFAVVTILEFDTGDDFLLEGDELNVTFTADSVCLVNGEAVSLVSGNLYNVTFSSISGVNLSFDCVGTIEDGNISIPYKNVSGVSTFSNQALMAFVENTLTLSNFQSRNESRNLSVAQPIYSASSCSFDYNGTAVDFSSSTSFEFFFRNSGDLTYVGECEFPFGNETVEVDYSTVVVYEPQLTEVDSHPFENLSSSSGFNLGNYDFDLDGNDDIVVVGSFGMLIYSGPNYSLVWNSSNESLSYAGVDFFITDMNWDGKGDMIVYSQSFVDVLTWDGAWSFSKEDLVDSSNIAYAGVFDIDGDFFKDVIVVNGSGNTWTYQHYLGQDLSLFNSTTYSEEKFRCSYVRSFDYDKDGYEEIVCLDDDVDSNNKLRFYDRNSTTIELDNTSLTSYFTHDLGYNAGIEGIFFTDINSDGVWDLGVSNDDDNNYYVYNVSDITIKLLQNSSIGTDFKFDGYYSIDILNSNNNQFAQTFTSDGSNYYFRFLYDNFLRIYDFRDFNFHPSIFYVDDVTGLNFDLDSDLDLVFSVSSDASTYYLRQYENNISFYVSTDRNYSANISIVENSTNVQFSFENITSDWNYNNYFFKVEHSADNTVYRNDVFDSKQNSKYYQVKDDNSYEFDFSNRDLYTITFALNPYNMILADPINLTKDAQGYECLTTESVCFINGSSLQTNVDVNASYVDFFSAGTQTTVRFTDSTFTDLELVLTNTSDVFTNVTFTNVTLNITESGFFKSFVNSTFINSSIYVSNATVYFNDSSFTNTIFNGSNYLLSNSSTINLTSLGSLISLPGLINRTDGLEESFGSTSSISGFWLYQNDSTLYNYTVIPETSFDYFPNQTNLSNLNVEYEISFTPTNIPYWNYSENTTHQTDFRNYTLLENISNITGVKLSFEGLNMTLETYEDFSDLNLSNRLNLTSDGFEFNLPGNWSINYSSALSNPIILKDGLNITLSNDSSIFYGTSLTSGTYEFTTRYNFSVNIPSNVVFNRSFNVTVEYIDKVTSADFSNTCSISFNSVEGSFVNMNLTTIGSVSYNVSCTGIDYVEEIGTIYVSNSLFFDWREEIGLFDYNDPNPDNPEVYIYSIFSISGYTSVQRLNESGNLFDDFMLENLPFSNSLDSIFYYSGNINSEKKEIIN